MKKAFMAVLLVALVSSYASAAMWMCSGTTDLGPGWTITARDMDGVKVVYTYTPVTDSTGAFLIQYAGGTIPNPTYFYLVATKTGQTTRWKGAWTYIGAYMQLGYLTGWKTGAVPW